MAGVWTHSSVPVRAEMERVVSTACVKQKSYFVPPEGAA